MKKLVLLLLILVAYKTAYTQSYLFPFKFVVNDLVTTNKFVLITDSYRLIEFDSEGIEYSIWIERYGAVMVRTNRILSYVYMVDIPALQRGLRPKFFKLKVIK